MQYDGRICYVCGKKYIVPQGYVQKKYLCPECMEQGLQDVVDGKVDGCSRQLRRQAKRVLDKYRERKRKYGQLSRV